MCRQSLNIHNYVLSKLCLCAILECLHLDICFIIDTAYTYNGDAEWESVKDFLKLSIEEMEIGIDATQVSVVFMLGQRRRKVQHIGPKLSFLVN